MVDKFEQNSYGLKNIVGNVWEWVEDSWSVFKKTKNVIYQTVKITIISINIYLEKARNFK